MKRLLLVIGLVAWFSLAASAKTVSYNFQFQASNSDPFCDGMLLYNYGNPQTLVDGTHTNVLCTGGSVPVNGFKAPVASVYQYDGSGEVLIVGDGTLIIECGEAEADNAQCFDTGARFGGPSRSNPASPPSSLDVHPGMIYLINPTTKTWILWVSGGGAGEYVVNYGKFDPVVGPLQESATPSQLPSSQRPRSSFQR